MTDKYDRAIEYFNERPNEIMDAFLGPRKHVAGCLFMFLGDRKVADFGCPIMVRGGYYVSSSTEITKAIRDDEKFPADPRIVTLSHLPRFAYYQRMYDATGLPR